MPTQEERELRQAAKECRQVLDGPNFIYALPTAADRLLRAAEQFLQSTHVDTTEQEQPSADTSPDAARLERLLGDRPGH